MDERAASLAVALAVASAFGMCKTFAKAWHLSLCARACIPHRNPHHLLTTPCF